jgi:hypothetical protein
MPGMATRLGTEIARKRERMDLSQAEAASSSAYRQAKVSVAG